MIMAISPHWADIISKTYICPSSLYRILACECFLSERLRPEVDALRRGLGAIEGCKIYRMTSEFDLLLEF